MLNSMFTIAYISEPEVSLIILEPEIFRDYEPEVQILH